MLVAGTGEARLAPMALRALLLLPGNTGGGDEPHGSSRSLAAAQ